MNESVRTRRVRVSLTRRELLRRGAAGGVALAAGGVLQACGTPEVSSRGARHFEPSGGAGIPSVEVRFAMWPFGDTAMGFIGIERGFFEDVGITLVPRDGETRLIAQTPGELLSGELDLASGYMPIQIQTFPKQPGIKMVQLHDVYVGNYLLAAPGVGAKRYGDFAGSGLSFEDAARSAIRQIRGKRLALGTAGNNRDFFSTLLSIAKLTPNDFALTVVDDAKILELARGRDIDFALPSGAAQNVVLMDEGFFRVFGIGQLLANLPPGDPRAVTALGHAGIVGTERYVNANTETVLRFMSVYYRIIDRVRTDPKAALAVVLPHLNASTGLRLTLDDCVVVFRRFYELVSFEQSADQLLDPRSPLQLDNVYGAQIAAATRAGIYKSGDKVTPEDIFVGTRLYRILADLKRRYEHQVRSRAPGGRLAVSAAEQYEHRNYLDAYRLVRVAGTG